MLELATTRNKTRVITETSENLWQMLESGCRALMTTVVAIGRDSLVAALADKKRVRVPSLSILMVSYPQRIQSEVERFRVLGRAWSMRKVVEVVGSMQSDEGDCNRDQT